MIRRRKEPEKGVSKRSFSSPVPYTTNSSTCGQNSNRRGFKESTTSSRREDSDPKESETPSSDLLKTTTNSDKDVSELRSSYLDKLFPTEHVEDVELDRPNHRSELEEDEPPASPLSRWLQKRINTDEPGHNHQDPPHVVEPYRYDCDPRETRHDVRREDGSVVTSGSTYLEDLEEQMRANQTKKAEEAQAEAALDAKCERDRLSMARYGGGGEPLRGPDGECITATRGIVHWTYESEELAPSGQAGSRHSSPSPSQKRVRTRSLHSGTPPKPQRSASNDATRSGKQLPLPKAPVAAAPSSAREDALANENALLKEEVKRLQAQMDLVMQAFQMERAK